MTSESRDLTLPLDSLHRRLGARMVSFAGYAMPIQYDGIIAEHQWTRSSAGLFDVSHMGQLLVTGDGAAAALERLMPGDFRGLGDGRLRYSMLLNDHGGILDDLIVTRRDVDHFGPQAQFYVVVNGAMKHADIALMQAALDPTGHIVHHLAQQALLALQGPQAVSVLAVLAPGIAGLGFMSGAWFDLAGTTAWVSRSGYTGEDGFEISVASGWAITVAEALLADPRVKPVGLGARDSLRLEAGLPLYGHDLTPETTPVEAGLAFAISKRRRSEGGFPGAGVILAQLAEGPARRRVGLAIDGRQPVREGAAVIVDDAVAGLVTSGGFGPALGSPIAMAYVPAAASADGTRIEVEVRGRRLAATVVPMPFFPKSYVRGDRP
jgi:aminomethyltransferase